MHAAARAAFAMVALSAASFGAWPQSPVVALGKQRAAASPLQWEVREAGHPVLGPIVFAFLKTPVSTPAGSAKVSSNIYVSCERSTAKIAIELANGMRPDDPGGLKPRTMPRLTCNTLGLNDGKPASEPIAAQWTANALGDVMARGLWPSALRDCASIGVSENLALPPDAGRETAHVELEITPYARELDAVFARCGEPTAWPYVAEASTAARDASPAAAPPPAASEARPKPSSAAVASNGWITARVVSEGHTNVRAAPSVRAALVIRLDPGDIVLVQKGEGDWYRAKSRSKARIAFEGFIRRDRLVFR
jgi:hypothetical protein